jgi:predicted small lipoprotein YifL
MIKKKSERRYFMAKKIISLLAVAMLLLGLLAACGNDGPLDEADAKEVVLADLGVKERQVDSIDVHISPVGTGMGYAVYVSMDDHHWVYLVDGLTGDIYSKTEADTGHSHSH